MYNYHQFVKDQRSKSLSNYQDFLNNKKQPIVEEGKKGRVVKYEQKVQSFINKMKIEPIKCHDPLKEIKMKFLSSFRDENPQRFLGPKVITSKVHQTLEQFQQPTTTVKNIKVLDKSQDIIGHKFIHQQLSTHNEGKDYPDPYIDRPYPSFRDRHMDHDIHTKEMKFTLPSLKERVITAIKDKAGGYTQADEYGFYNQYSDIMKDEIKKQSKYKKFRSMSEFAKVDTSQVYPEGFKGYKKAATSDFFYDVKQEHMRSMYDSCFNKDGTPNFHQRNLLFLEKLKEKQNDPLLVLYRKVQLEDHMNMSPRKLGCRLNKRTHFTGAKSYQIKQQEIYRQNSVNKRYPSDIIEEDDNIYNSKKDIGLKFSQEEIKKYKVKKEITPEELSYDARDILQNCKVYRRRNSRIKSLSKTSYNTKLTKN